MVIKFGLPQEQVDEVRNAVRQYQNDACKSYADLAVMSHLSYHAVAQFMNGRSGSERVVAHLVAYLPIERIYVRPVVELDTPSK
jgi:hypothetical protein